MMLLALAPLSFAVLCAQPDTLTRILNRVSEEAEVFAREAPLMISQETLRQHALRSQSRFRPRIGAEALKTHPLVYQDRILVSEYGFTTLEGSPGVVREMRRVVSVDGKKVESEEKARQSLTLSLKSDSDRAKKKLLQDFEKNGLIGAAVDFGQLILQFRRRNLAKFHFEMKGETRSGPDEVLIVAFRQQAGPGGLTLYQGNDANRAELTGEVWVRKNDFLPVRVSLTTERKDGESVTRHTAAVDYQRTPFGVLAPAAVKHQEIVNGILKTENRYEYTPFRKFAADAEIKFTEVPEMPK
jgi:hypothetical protein